jgi:hypothetical protein
MSPVKEKGDAANVSDITRSQKSFLPAFSPKKLKKPMTAR